MTFSEPLALLPPRMAPPVLRELVSAECAGRMGNCLNWMTTPSKRGGAQGVGVDPLAVADGCFGGSGDSGADVLTPGRAGADCLGRVELWGTAKSELGARGRRRPPPQATVAADPGGRSTEHLTVEASGELLSTPMPATKSGLDHDRRTVERRADLSVRVGAGSTAIDDAASGPGISYDWALQLLDRRRRGRGDPAVLRQMVLDRLETDEGRARLAMRRTTEPVFGTIKATLPHRRCSGRETSVVEREWRLICSVHDLLTMRNRRRAPGGTARPERCADLTADHRAKSRPHAVRGRSCDGLVTDTLSRFERVLAGACSPIRVRCTSRR